LSPLYFAAHTKRRQVGALHNQFFTAITKYVLLIKLRYVL